MLLLPLHTSSWSARAPRWQVTLSLLLEMIFTLSEDMTASGASARDLTNTMWSLKCGWTWQQADLPPKVCIVHGGGCFADQSLFIAWGWGGGGILGGIGAEGDQSSPMRTREMNHKNIVLQSFMGGSGEILSLYKRNPPHPPHPSPFPSVFH